MTLLESKIKRMRDEKSKKVLKTKPRVKKDNETARIQLTVRQKASKPISKEANEAPVYKKLIKTRFKDKFKKNTTFDEGKGTLGCHPIWGLATSPKLSKPHPSKPVTKGPGYIATHRPRNINLTLKSRNLDDSGQIPTSKLTGDKPLKPKSKANKFNLRYPTTKHL